MKVAFLLVTCCLEESRAKILHEVVHSLKKELPPLGDDIIVFDNASTTGEVSTLLQSNFNHVYVANKNVGYWTAVHWWLNQLRDDPPAYTHIIESDTIYYNFERFANCVNYLDTHSDVGSVRLHRYSVKNQHLYNKDVPHPQSDRKIWQSHWNRVAKIPVTLTPSEGDIWLSTFLTQLPALNRYETMLQVFNQLEQIGEFSELDFQRLYWKRYQKTAILDGGLLHADPGADYRGPTVTGSWTDPRQLTRLGYQQTRHAMIYRSSDYTVTKL